MPGPWRRDFDAARDPYTARNALGITSLGGGGAPTDAEYIVAVDDPTLTNDRVLTNTATITWDLATAGQVKANATVPALHGQCRLIKSGSNAVLLPFNGNKITINSTAETIPDAGVSLAPSGLTAATVYNVYAYMSSGTMTLEASTTAHSAQTGTGVEIKTGDATRTLVGKVMPIAGPAFADTVRQRFVITWFNRQPVHMYLFWTGSSGTTNGTLTNLGAILEFLCWTTSAVTSRWWGHVFNATNTAYTYTALGLDGGNLTPGLPNEHSSANNKFATTVTFTFTSDTGITEGYHYLNTYGSVSAGTGNWGNSIVSVYPVSSALLNL